MWKWARGALMGRAGGGVSAYILLGLGYEFNGGNRTQEQIYAKDFSTWPGKKKQ